MNKLHRGLPWLPTCWVDGTKVIQLCNMSDDSREKYAAIKATSAILRAMRK